MNKGLKRNVTAARNDDAKQAANDEPRDVGSEYNPKKIRTIAYKIFQRRGGAAGHELEDWLEAENRMKKYAQGEIGGSRKGEMLRKE